MRVSLVPRAAPVGCLRVWIGVLADRQPALAWFLDGAPVADAQVQPLREIASAIPPNLIGDHGSANFTGVYELRDLQPGTAYIVSVRADDGTLVKEAQLRTNTLPSEVPGVLDRPFNVLLVSCFHQAEDRAGHAAIVASRLTGPARPDLTLLLGDQVYLDLPTLADFPNDASALALKFESDYRANWQSEAGYSQLLALAPTASLPDDHEYWNNYPHRSPLIQNSWNEAGRENWTRAASALYEAFQFSYDSSAYFHGDKAQLGDATVIDVAPLSFFLADGRSRRDYDRASVFTSRAIEQLDHWVEETIQRRGTGIFVTGQSLLDTAAGWFKGRVADFTMPNYGDFRQITTALARLTDARLPMVLITGDVHWGRVATARDVRFGRESILEIISSPTSLVSSVGQDQWRSIWDRLRGEADAWPRHSKADKVPDFLWFGGFGTRFACSGVHEQRGNHVALLSFARSGAGVRLQTAYYPIHSDQSHARPEHVREIALVPA